MRGYDLAPLFRTSIGFDPLFQLLDGAMKMDEAAAGYPPYNIEKTGADAYRITMAVAGFAPETINIVAQDSALRVTGRQEPAEDGRSFLHRGIAARAFERRFQLAGHVQVTGASMKDGLLHIDLVREVPQALRPRAIPISTGDAPRVESAGKAH